MAYHRWSSEGQNPCPLYIWMGDDGLHVWKPGQGDEEGLLFRNGKDTAVAEALVTALVDHLAGQGKQVRIRAGKVTFKDHLND